MPFGELARTVSTPALAGTLPATTTGTSHSRIDLIRSSSTRSGLITRPSAYPRAIPRTSATSSTTSDPVVVTTSR